MTRFPFQRRGSGTSRGEWVDGQGMAGGSEETAA